MQDLTQAISLLRVIQTMQDALQIRNPVELKDYVSDDGLPAPGLLYNDASRAGAIAAMLPGFDVHPVVQYIHEGTGEPAYYKDTIGLDVFYVTHADDEPCVVIPLDDELSSWVQISANGWSVENDWNRPIWYNAIPVVLLEGEDAGTDRFKLEAAD